MSKVNKRSQMVKNSRWRFTQDADIVQKVVDVRGSEDAYTTRPWGSVKAGEEFTVVSGKMKNGLPVAHYIYTSGLSVEIEFRGQKMYAPYAGIEPYIEAVDVPQTKVFVLRDSATGLLFGGFENRYLDARFGGPSLIMTDKFMKAKRYDDMNKLRLHVMGWTGYYVGLDEIGYWEGGDLASDKVMDLPPTWETVAFDKVAKTEIGVVPGLQEWNKRLWELRGLTAAYGSATRALFKKLDDADETGNYRYILTMRAPMRHGVIVELSEDQKAEFDEAVAGLGLSRKDVRRVSDKHSIALAFKDETNSVLSCLSYTGSLKLIALDAQSLKEVVALGAS